MLREVASQRWLFVSDDDQGWIISSSLPGTLCKMWFVADDSHQWKVTLEFRQHCQITVKSFKLHLETSAVNDSVTDVKIFRPIRFFMNTNNEMMIQCQRPLMIKFHTI